MNLPTTLTDIFTTYGTSIQVERNTPFTPKTTSLYLVTQGALGRVLSSDHKMFMSKLLTSEDIILENSPDTTYQSISESATLIEIPLAQLESLAKTHHELLSTLSQHLGQTLQDVEARFMIQASYPAPHIINAWLLYLAKKLGIPGPNNRVEIKYRLTIPDIARQLGLARQTVQAQFTVLEKAGILSHNLHTTLIYDTEQLQSLIQQ